jgi:hypothetical protein
MLVMSIDPRLDLSHVVWVGGAPRAGKTTVCRLLAGKYDLKIYLHDWHYWRDHQKRLVPERHPVSMAMRGASADQWWVEPSVGDIVERAIALWTESFGLVLEDLYALPRSRVVLAEGPGLLPWLVAPLLSSPQQALFITPTSDFRDAVLKIKLGSEKFGAGTRDPERAAAKHREHDRGLAERVIESCRDLGLHAITMDGSLGIAEAASVIEKHLQPHLPSELNV